MWHSIEDVTRFQEFKKLIAYQLLLHCQVDQCSGLIAVHLITGPGLTTDDAPGIASSFFFHAVTCTRGHKTTGKLGGTSISFNILPSF